MTEAPDILHFLQDSDTWNAFRRAHPGFPGFGGVDLTGKELRGIDFRGLKLEQVLFQGARLADADFTSSLLSDCQFDHADVLRAKFQLCRLTGCSFRSATLAATDFSQATLEGCAFNGCSLIGGAAAESTISHTTFDHADLSAVRAYRAKLMHVSFRGARLDGADLSYVSVEQVDFANATLENALAYGTRLDQAHLTAGQLVAAETNSSIRAYAHRWRSTSLVGLATTALSAALFLSRGRFDDLALLTIFTTVIPLLSLLGLWIAAGAAQREPAKRLCGVSADTGAKWLAAGQPSEAAGVRWAVATQPAPPAALPPGTLRVFVVTNRRPVRDAASFGEYTDELHYAQAVVTPGADPVRPEGTTAASVVTLLSIVGLLAANAWRRLRRQPQQLETSTIDALVEISEPAFWDAARGSGAGRHVLFFIHGFNVSFEAAVLSAAELAKALKMDTAIVYSWPSNAFVLDYQADRETIEASVSLVAATLHRLLAEFKEHSLHVLAHSMGNFGLCQALDRLSSDPVRSAVGQLQSVVLLAPDVDRRLFLQRAGSLTKLSQRVTLYASSSDLALAISSRFAKMSRAGAIPPVTVAPGVDTIDASAFDLSVLSHSPHGAQRVREDLFVLTHHGAPPQQRRGLTPIDTASGRYWKLSRA